MSVVSAIIRIGLCAGLITCMVRCNSNNEVAAKDTRVETDTIGLVIQAEDFLNTHGDASIQGENKNEQYIKATSGGWLEYKLTVPVAGRYRVRLFAQSPDTIPIDCWVEDYADNLDGRSYNITGNARLEDIKNEGGFNMVEKEGTPLDTGMHTMRIHYDSGLVLIDKIGFKLMQAHMGSPKIHTQQTVGKEWALTWSDEFEGKGLPDSSKWSYDIGDWGWGNNELQYYTEAKTNNARVGDGFLTIEAHKNDNGKPWTSARLTTRGKESFLYGKIEFRAKVPAGRGSWAAGWLLGDDYVDEKSWPFCGEADVLETVGYENDSTTTDGVAHGSIHCGAYYFKLNNQPTQIQKVRNMNGEFHTYSMVWMPSGISILIDGKKYFDYHDTRTPLSWPYSKPQNLVLNLAMGGGMGGAKGVDPRLTSQKLVVDYVRVYALQ